MGSPPLTVSKYLYSPLLFYISKLLYTYQKSSFCFPSASTQSYRFAGKTMTSGSLVLVTVVTKADEGTVQLTVNCEKMVIGTMLVKDILQALNQ